MIKHKRKGFILVSILTLGALISLMTSSLAWFVTMLSFNTDITGQSISNYYASGTGTQIDPYILKTPQHFYNLTWLQNNGYYSNKTYFKLDNDVDMAGSLTGLDGVTTGAIPPIGTDAYPFIGEFDGNGKTISNLWVSSDPNDWKEKPLSISNINVGLSIGFFGNVGNIALSPTVAVIGTVKSFYLQNIEVTCKVSNGHVGIVAGYTNGNITAVGVKNAKISVGTTSIPVSSDYSLVGQVGPYVSWDDSPDDLAGGDLIIDPNRPNSYFSDLLSGTRVVEGSALDTAYYISNLRNLAIKGGTGYNFYKYNSTVLCTTSTTRQDIFANSNNVITVNPTNYSGYVSQDFYERYYASTTTRTVTFGSVAPSFSNTINLTLSNNQTISVPRNSIWFKPLKGGVSGLSFLRQSQAAGYESLSVYHFKRSGSTITNFGEVRFSLDKISNKAAVYFDFEIPQTMVNEGYEFLVAASTLTPAQTSGFLYLSLAGSDESAGYQAAQMLGVDYVYREATGFLQDVSNPSYIVKKTLLRISGTYNGAVVYNTKDSPNIDGLVYYATQSGTLTIQDVIVTSSAGAPIAYSVGMFPSRQDALP